MQSNLATEQRPNQKSIKLNPKSITNQRKKTNTKQSTIQKGKKKKIKKKKKKNIYPFEISKPNVSAHHQIKTINYMGFAQNHEKDNKNFETKRQNRHKYLLK